MKLTKQERQELENKKLALKVRNKRLDNLRLIIQIPLTTLLLGLAIIELIKFNNKGQGAKAPWHEDSTDETL